MNASIEFDHEQQFRTVKIGDKTENDLLPPKLPAAEAARAQPLPNFGLCWSLPAAQCLGDYELFIRSSERDANGRGV